MIESQETTAAAMALRAVTQALQIEVELADAAAWPLESSAYLARARLVTAAETFYGFGAGLSADLARRRAIMECVERYAQFGPSVRPVTTLDPYTSLQAEAILPTTCGLYSKAQYEAPGFGFMPFSEQTPLEWVEVSELLTGQRRLLPAEFVYPRLRLARRPLVAETSNGTAAHLEPERAVLAALYELVERDSLMLFWYRQPQTAVMPVEAIPVPGLGRELRRVQAMGYVVAVCRLVYDLELPCFLIIGLKGDTLAYGSGCHQDWQYALEQARLEFGRSLRYLQESPARTTLYRSLPEVRTPEDHYNLYNRGPLHQVLRQVLVQTLRPAGQEMNVVNDEFSQNNRTLKSVLELLAGSGYPVYGCDLTPAILADCGVRVVRVIAPGLIPIHFGYGRLRLGCRRLWAAGNPGRLSTLLPHFMA